VTTPSDPSSADHHPDARSREQIEEEIEATRRQLGETVDQLSERLDVKSRIKAEAQHRREQLAAEMQRRPAVPAAVAAGVVLLTTLVVWRRRRRRG
jgi:F0F1-type ATP synthase alpha subunit